MHMGATYRPLGNVGKGSVTQQVGERDPRAEWGTEHGGGAFKFVYLT